MKKAPLALFAVLALVLAYQFFAPAPSQEAAPDRMEMVQEIKAFAGELGFEVTENFRSYSRDTVAYDYYFYAPALELPHSLDDPLLRYGAGAAANVTIDLAGYDIYFYSIQALAGRKTPVTRSLMEAPLSRFIRIIFHEDWHEQITQPLGIEEPSGELVSYQAAMLFAGMKYGLDSEERRAQERQWNNKLRESEVYRRYYQLLSDAYDRFHAGEAGEAETLRVKAGLFDELGRELEAIWGGRPQQLNNAFIAFQMTYQRHLPLMYQVYLASGGDLAETIKILRSMPEQPWDYQDVAQVKAIEEQLTEYLLGFARGVEAAP